MDYRARLLQHLGEPPNADAVNFRVEGDVAKVVIHHGIAGSPKYTVPLSELDAVAVAEVPPPPEPAPPLDATRAARRLLDAARLAVAAARHFKGERVTKRAAEQFIEEYENG